MTSKKRRVIGIDPGLTGAIAILPEKVVLDMPAAPTGGAGAVKRMYVQAEMVAIIERFVCQSPLEVQVEAVIEQQRAFPKQGRSSIFSLATGYGIWLGIFAAFKVPLHIVTPVEWKREMLAGMGKEKEAARVRALELYPDLADQLGRVKDHNRAEALLLARYGEDLLFDRR